MREYFLKTGRISFSHWREEDLALAKSLWGRREVARFICARGVFTEEEIRARLKTEIENEGRFHFQYFPIFALESGELIGCCGLRPCEEADTLELGCHLLPEYRGQGLAQEAVGAVIRYAFSHLGVSALMAGHHPDNAASEKLLRRAGFSYAEHRLYPPTGRKHPTYFLKKPENERFSSDF